ncbi:MAG TPA: hypothetical protein VN697_13745 [Tepidiformaceae bacterium]|nr:hypothetical protein [Tepidiformaceae bacterium]
MPNRAALGLLRLVARIVLWVVRLLMKVAGAAVFATAVVFILDMVLLGDKRRAPQVLPRPSTPPGR